MQVTNISWGTYTYNPVTGCSKIGPECVNCYAERVSLQYDRTPHEWTHEHAAENVTMHPDRLDAPDEYHYPEGPGRVFVGSMTDMFHREVDPGFVQRVLDKCRAHPEHVWVFLTKRPQNAADWRLDWPANTMLGVSVGTGPGGEYPDTTHRIDELREVDVPQRWISFEPLIERVGPVELHGIDWIVVGGETAAEDDRRELDHDWARELLEQARAYDIPYFFKQDSAHRPEMRPWLAVKNEERGIWERRKIREFPALPDVTRQARGEELIADGGEDLPSESWYESDDTTTQGRLPKNRLGEQGQRVGPDVQDPYPEVSDNDGE